jgi:hypothetical protein
MNLDLAKRTISLIDLFILIAGREAGRYCRHGAEDFRQRQIRTSDLRRHL